MTGDRRTVQRRFLFLQGPHGPFFHRLAAGLRAAGCDTLRVGFNQGDRVFWPNRNTYIPFTQSLQDWPDTVRDLIANHQITDLVLYGDTRPIHAQAIQAARAADVTIHVFEEGYLRPFWVTYERGGSNGNSPLMQMSVPQMRASLAAIDIHLPEAPVRWGDMRQHVFYGALYHFFVMAANRRYRAFRPHRGISVAKEFRLYLTQLLMMPIRRIDRFLATWRIRRGSFPYHLVPMQLEHDASFRSHSPFSSMTEFLELCVDGFAKGAPPHHHLVFKTHPLEDGRAALRQTIRKTARRHGIADRVHFVHGGKLARLLDDARSVITVNSTAAQQALGRGLPVKAFGTAVYSKPEFVSDQPLTAFLAQPRNPDIRAYRDYRRFLLETSQVPGGFYSMAARRQLLRQLVDMMLAPEDPYVALSSGKAAPRQHLNLAR